VAVGLLAAGPASAARPVLVVTVSDSPDPAPSQGQVTYAVNVKNNGTTRGYNVKVTMPLPSGTQFVKCAVSTKKACTLASGVISTTLGTMLAHQEIKVSVVLNMPAVTAKSVITVSAKANGTLVTDGSGSTTTTILASTANVTFLPSNRAGTVSCGATLSSAVFGTDTTVKFVDGLGCATGNGFTIAASGKTVDLNKNKVIGATLKGNVGITIGSGATNVTVIGGSTGGSSGLEYFDYCVKEQGGNTGLTLSGLRCFRARSAGVYSVSNGVTMTGLLLDKVVGASSSTTETLPGGVGIRALGNAHIKDTIVRRSGAIGIWADGATDPDHDGVVVLIDGNTTTSRIEDSTGIGLLLEGGPHSVKDTLVAGDSTPGPNKDGVVIGDDAVNTVLDGVVVKNHGGNAFVVGGTGIKISRSSADAVALDGFAVSAANAVLSGNQAHPAGNGFVVTGDGAALTSNTAENAGLDGFVVAGTGATLSGNNAKTGAGRGFVLGGSAGTYNTNTAESNAGNGFEISSGGGQFTSNRAKQNTGTGFQVSGSGNTFKTNIAELSGGAEWVIAAGNTDGGGNTANGAQFSFTSGGITIP
jgi:uncharacterized repeat protein (TIGR01451 family)